jgi:hypothetical protein
MAVTYSPQRARLIPDAMHRVPSRASRTNFFIVLIRAAIGMKNLFVTVRSWLCADCRIFGSYLFGASRGRYSIRRLSVGFKVHGSLLLK